ncbi:MAG: xanthine dehydrogenase family protein subunit M [Acidobacteria bacterium]|nr:xanthine dehydrogenase family protein subunit M [Acidobacteriota bacterium]
MYPAEFEYFAPRSVDEALQLLARYGEEAKILAGGQSLLPMMKLRIAGPRYLIDLNRIEGLSGLRREGDRLVFGALCRHADVAASALVREHLPIMTDAARLTADVQVRNRGTLAGSLAHADPAGDWPAALMALDTAVVIAGRSGTRDVPLHEFIIDAYSTQLDTVEMVVGVSVGIPAGPSGGAYVKFEKRAGDFAVASIGVQIGLDPGSPSRTSPPHGARVRRGGSGPARWGEGGDRCGSVAISLGALGPMPFRAREAEDALQGAAPSADRVDRAVQLVREAAQPFADTRGSVEYKRHLAGVLFRRAFTAALDRARGREVDTLHM